MPEREHNVQTVPLSHEKLTRGAGDRLVLLLDHLDESLHDRGAYGGDGDDEDTEPGDFIPKRYRYLHTDAHRAMLAVENAHPGVFYYSDVFRNASGSKGRREKNRAGRIRQGKSAIYTGKKPGFSAHSYGLCFDLDVDRSLENLRDHLDDQEIDKADLDAILRQHGWWCHRDGPIRGDHKRGSEDWHFNYLGDDPDRWLGHSGQKTSGGVEAKVQYLHGPFTLDPQGVDEHLIRLGCMADVDSQKQRAALRKDAIKKFQIAWTLVKPNGEPDGVAGPVTQRTLLYVAAELRNSDGGTLAPMPRFP